MKDKDIGSLEHTSWRCQYHVVFAPKFRRQAIYSLREDELADQMSLKEFVDPFTGSVNKKA